MKNIYIIKAKLQDLNPFPSTQKLSINPGYTLFDTGQNTYQKKPVYTTSLMASKKHFSKTSANKRLKYLQENSTEGLTWFIELLNKSEILNFKQSEINFPTTTTQKNPLQH